MIKYNIGFLGAGKISEKIVEALKLCDKRVVLYGVASRTYQNAQRFAKDNNITYTFKTYRELAKCPEIDLIYISTPTGLHYEHIKMCLEFNKHVICEKTITENSTQLKELIELAKVKKKLLFDATWSMYMPFIPQLLKKLEDGEIGEIKSVFTSFGYPGLDNKRLMDSKLGGGALLDLGIYCISMINILFKDNYRIIKSNSKYKDGVDIDDNITIDYNGVNVKIVCSIKRRTSYLLRIRGSKGMIMSRKFWTGTSFFVFKYPFTFKVFQFNHVKNGYEYELIECLNCLDENLIESKQYSLSYSLANMEMIDSILHGK